MGTPPPSDLSHCPGSAQSAVPAVEGRSLRSRSCPTCQNPAPGGACICTPAVSAQSQARSSPVPRIKQRFRQQQRAAESAITPQDVTPSGTSTESCGCDPPTLLRRQLFKTDTTRHLEDAAQPGPSSEAQAGTSTSRGAHGGGSGRRTRHLCPRCPKSFSSPGKLSQHMYSHTGERPFVCQHCAKAFSSKFKLVRHALIHSDLRQYTCPICERTFHRKDHLKNHAKVHDPIKNLYACDRPGCGKEYSSLLSYRKHVAVHAAEDGNLECTMCGLKFSTKEEIVFHLKVHAGSRTVKTAEDRKYRCERCDRSFFTGKDVRRHMVVHTGKRDFLCQFCPQRFGRKDHLVRHIKKSHNSTGKKAKTKRSEAKTKSVQSILVETGRVKGVESEVKMDKEEDSGMKEKVISVDDRGPGSSFSIVSGFGSGFLEDKEEESELKEGDEEEQIGTSFAIDPRFGYQFSEKEQVGEMKHKLLAEEQQGVNPPFPIVSTSDTKPAITTTLEGNIISQPSTSLMSPLVFESTSQLPPPPPLYPLHPFETEIKTEGLPEFVNVDQLPLLILPDSPPVETHPTQFLSAEEPQHISRHIMNLTAPGTSSDPDLIMPTFLSPSTDQSGSDDQFQLPCTPLPRFNQAFNQQPP